MNTQDKLIILLITWLVVFFGGLVYSSVSEARWLAARTSYYGPGLYGNTFACGGVLYPSTRGVAHKTLPCGTILKLRTGARSIRVMVRDRGPYNNVYHLDLTTQTSRDLCGCSTPRNYYLKYKVVRYGY